MAPLKTFLPSWKVKGAIGKIRRLQNLHIISSEFICIQWPWNVVSILPFQPVRSRSWRRHHEEGTFPLELKLPHCIWIGHPPKHLVPWPDVLQFYLLITPFNCFGLILIDVVYCLEPGPFYGVFCYFAILFIFCRSQGPYWAPSCFFQCYCFVTKQKLEWCKACWPLNSSVVVPHHLY